MKTIFYPLAALLLVSAVTVPYKTAAAYSGVSSSPRERAKRSLD